MTKPFTSEGKTTIRAALDQADAAHTAGDTAGEKAADQRAVTLAQDPSLRQP